MKTRTRKHVHVGLAVFFGLQMPITPFVFHDPFQVYLVWISQYALVAAHLAGASSETPN